MYGYPEQQARRQSSQARNCRDQPKFAHAIDIIQVQKAGSIGDRAVLAAMLSSQIDAKEAHGEVQRGVYLPELRSSFAEVAGAVCRVGRGENPAGRSRSGQPPQKGGTAPSPPDGPLVLAGRRSHSRARPLNA